MESVLYRRIKELTQEKHESLAQVERTLGLSNGIISTWKTGKASADKVKLIANYFGVTTDYLLGNSDETHGDNRPKLQKIARNASKLDDSDLSMLDGIMEQIFKEKFDDNDK
ncbi:helix-turn-helix domain-containing protein [Lactobacillus selangorensis]|uniref:helix-turn-helix domain-containing protein n=1 Tax=Lactobacillus selangorensis TaxID=81857 RepID=UPI0007107182|nr:helix-turn-helix transcriptional regulator [Lactobacillus selangorensis]